MTFATIACPTSDKRTLTRGVNATDPVKRLPVMRKLRHLSKGMQKISRLPSTCVLQETNGLVVECQAFAKRRICRKYNRGFTGSFGQIAVQKVTPRCFAAAKPELLFLEGRHLKHANHRNIAPFIAALVHAPSPCLISPMDEPWQYNLLLEEHPETDIQPLILNIIDGCRFLHGSVSSHGDLREPTFL
ncbi:hypothetical protein BT96DRAFT_702206 [Gymnopus androsaceus JB14]|uniref:Protein kinase domain-containing protein n=1 Tax=Gymnopus androsaceus JB14 TaxID=1447944 RepID=A0A6A4HQA3_9AGAR|nr:hypothetical protein BT96DRAFT_702206 [Gymnopus androsaceus JB14]